MVYACKLDRKSVRMERLERDGQDTFEYMISVHVGLHFNVILILLSRYDSSNCHLKI